jgi:uncharacterized DUF497 family protein
VDKTRFEWDAAKDFANQRKHHVTFALAQFAFADPQRVIAKDMHHSDQEPRFYCFGWVDERVLTVRFTYREGLIRIIGAGFWRKGKTIYEEENKLHR